MKITRDCWQCEYKDCGHVWIATDPESPPSQCSKCKRRGWHTVSAIVQNTVKAAKRRSATTKSRLRNKSKIAKQKLGSGAAPASAAPIVERAVQMATAKAQTHDSKKCPTCGGQAFFRMFAQDYWCPKCGKKAE